MRAVLLLRRPPEPCLDQKVLQAEGVLNRRAQDFCLDLDGGRWMFDVGRWALDVRRGRDVARWMLDVEDWTLDIGCSDVGRWTLDC